MKLLKVPTLKMIHKYSIHFVLLTILFGVLSCSETPDDTVLAPRYAEAVAELERIINHEMETKGIPSFSIALVDGEELVWAKTFGMSDYENNIPATNETIYKIGSVSKLFTDIAIMQLVEKGELDIDAPVTTYVPEFQPENPFGTEITLRQLMTHRSGLVREPPVGNYFDDEEPSLAETVASLNSTKLVFEPEKQTKYSNAAIGVVGYVLEKLKNKPFAEYMSETLVQPLGMTSSAFAPNPEINSRLAKAMMWRFDGKEFVAPEFQLGFAPAGSMYSTMTDLAKFMVVMIKGGGDIVSPETLNKMWTPQFTENTTGFGLGFSVGNFRDNKMVAHGGAIYGFATDLKILPDAGLGVAASASKDVVNSVVGRITNHALEVMLAVKNGETIWQIPLTEEIPFEEAKNAQGVYTNGDIAIELNTRNGKLFLETDRSILEIRNLEGEMIIDDGLSYGSSLSLIGDILTYRGNEYKKIAYPSPKPSSASPVFREYIGEYGWDHNILYLYETNGGLTALLEWIEIDNMQEVAKDTYAFPDNSMYIGENLTFTRDNSGRITEAIVGVVPFKRREVGTADGETFVINSVKPYDELFTDAQNAQPPVESGDMLDSDLVEVITLDPTIKLDIRYATTNNFMQSVFYSEPRAFLQREAAEGIIRVHNNLKQYGYGVLIHDAYRPWYVTKMFWDATPEDFKIFVANPANGSVHNRGGAIDMTLFDLATGEPVQMVGGYDEFSDRSFPFYVGGTSEQRWLRNLLRKEMEREGFNVNEWEWWHFDHQNARKFPIRNVLFDKIEGS